MKGATQQIQNRADVYLSNLGSDLRKELEPFILKPSKSSFVKIINAIARDDLSFIQKCLLIRLVVNRFTISDIEFDLSKFKLTKESIKYLEFLQHDLYLRGDPVGKIQWVGNLPENKGQKNTKLQIQDFPFKIYEVEKKAIKEMRTEERLYVDTPLHYENEKIEKLLKTNKVSLDETIIIGEERISSEEVDDLSEAVMNFDPVKSKFKFFGLSGSCIARRFLYRGNLSEKSLPLGIKELIKNNFHSKVIFFHSTLEQTFRDLFAAATYGGGISGGSYIASEGRLRAWRTIQSILKLKTNNLHHIIEKAKKLKWYAFTSESFFWVTVVGVICVNEETNEITLIAATDGS
ncbi:MAG TPA: DUF6183 family protein [Candidatus Dojkabacteria bacterium]